MRLYAWTNRETPDDLVAMAARFPGLGLVLYPRNYAAAPPGGPHAWRHACR
jgi:hypothetical protein